MIPVVGYNCIAVFGLGITGKAVVKAALETPGVSVYACDDNEQALVDLKNSIGGHERMHFCTSDAINWKDVEVLVLSPGVPTNYPEPHKIVKLAKENGCPIISDIEMLWMSQKKSKFIGITGTNGKSTTTKLIYDILKAHKINAQLGGNIGEPAMALQKDADVYVLELSSFQLDLQDKMKYDCSIILNITPDHSDRYSSIDEYINSKMKIFTNSVMILGIDSEYTEKIYKKMQDSVLPISSRQQLEKGVWLLPNGNLMANTELNIKNRQVLVGKHNEENICAAAAAALTMNVPAEIITNTINNFITLNHRFQIAGKIKNITFINDSKATTPESTQHAILSCQNKRVLLILGGKEKYQNSLAILEKELVSCSIIYLVGSSTREFRKFLSGKAAFKECDTLDNAMVEAYKDAQQTSDETIILLSPACASTDQWKNFEERGNFFVRQATELIGKP